MTGKKVQIQQKQYSNKNPIETIRNIGNGVSHSVADDLIKGGMKDLGEEFLSFLGLSKSNEKGPKKSVSGDLKEGQEINLLDLIGITSTSSSDNSKNLYSESLAEKKPYIEPGFDYRREILQAELRSTRENNQEITNKIQEIIIELKRLTSSSKILQAEFKEVTTDQRITKPGKYHLNFFDWVLSVVKTARMRVEDAGAWLSVMKSKKAQRGYWEMFKKHGTTFGLSNERVAATQSG